MKMSNNSLKKKLEDILRQRTTVLDQLADTGPLVVGYVYDVLRKCGNPYCHCRNKPAHRQTLLVYSRNGRRYCKLVRRQDEQRIKQAWQNYRNFKKGIQQIHAINKRELSILMAKIKKEELIYK